VAGWLLDRRPGIEGHQQFFLFLAASAAVGLIAALAFRTVRGEDAVYEPS